MPATAAIALGSPFPNASTLQGHFCLVGTRGFKQAGSVAPQESLSSYSVPGHYNYTPKPQAPGFAILWCQESSFPTEHEGTALPIVPDTKRALTPLPKSKNDRFPTEGRKTVTYHSAGGTRSPIPPKYTETQCFMMHLPAEESHLSCPRDGIPATPLSGNPLSCWC
jgi:hypothetical protein